MGCERTALRLETLAQAGAPMSVPTLARVLGCSPWYIRKCLAAGCLHAGRIGREYRITVEEAVRFARDTKLLRD